MNNIKVFSLYDTVSKNTIGIFETKEETEFEKVLVAGVHRIPEKELEVVEVEMPKIAASIIIARCKRKMKDVN